MVKIRVDGKEYEVEYFARFSETPPHVGVGLRPAEEAWALLKEKKGCEINHDGKWRRAVVKQEVDVGERTWFILEMPQM